MTSIHDPSRLRDIAGNPKWLDADSLIPTLMIKPIKPEQWAIIAWIYFPIEDLSRQLTCVGTFNQICEVLLVWEADPEDTCAAFFDHAPPIGNRASRAKSQAPTVIIAHGIETDDLGI